MIETAAFQGRRAPERSRVKGARMSWRTGTSDKAAAAQGKSEGGLWETVKVVVEALLIALVVRTLLFQPFNIPSGSMIPTLLDRRLPVRVEILLRLLTILAAIRRLISSRDACFGSRPKRGDVAVFKLPRDQSSDYIKRVIGLPGETHPGHPMARLIINGEMVPREPIAENQARKISTATLRRCRDLSGNAARRRAAHHHRTAGRHRLQRQHARCLYGAAGQLLHDGRQPRQFHWTPASRPQQGGVGFRARSRTWKGRAEIIFFSVGKGRAGVGLLGMAVDAALRADFSTGQMISARLGGSWRSEAILRDRCLS